MPIHHLLWVTGILVEQPGDENGVFVGALLIFGGLLLRIEAAIASLRDRG